MSLNSQSTIRDPARRNGLPRDEAEDARRVQLIEVTIDSLAEVGFVGTTLAEIARRAGVSPGLVAHYFGDKDGLLEGAFRTLARVVAALMRERLALARTGLLHRSTDSAATPPVQRHPGEGVVVARTWLVHNPRHACLRQLSAKNIRGDALSHSRAHQPALVPRRAGGRPCTVGAASPEAQATSERGSEAEGLLPAVDARSPA